MQQQPPSATAPPLPFPPNAVTTEQIQMCLDENKKLILKILEHQSHGKLAECAQFQAVLQRNLMYLAAVADAQPPPTTTAPSQLAPSSGAQQGNSMQQIQTLTLQQQQGVPLAKLPFQLNALRSQDQQHQLLHFQSQQKFQGQAGSNNGMPQILQPGHSISGSLMEGRGSE